MDQVHVFRYNALMPLLADIETKLFEKVPHSRKLTRSAFARAAGLNSRSAVTMVFRGKRLPPRRFVEGICRKLSLGVEERRYLDLLIQKEDAFLSGKTLNRSIVEEMQLLNPLSVDQAPMEEDQFAMISQWYHLPLSYLASRSGPNKSPLIFVKRLRNKVSLAEVRQGLERLARLGVIKIKNGAVQNSDPKPLKISSEVPSIHMRTHHKQMMMRAMDALDEQAMDRRRANSITLPIADKNVSRAIEDVTNFCQQFRKKYFDSQSCSIYQLNLQLFEHTQEVIQEKS